MLKWKEMKPVSHFVNAQDIQIQSDIPIVVNKETKRPSIIRNHIPKQSH